MRTLPEDMSEEMLQAAHDAAHTTRHLPWREAEKARWRAVLAAAPVQDDSARLVWAMNHIFMDSALRDRFAAYVLSVGGVGDLGDCRLFIDACAFRPTQKQRARTP